MTMIAACLACVLALVAPRQAAAPNASGAPTPADPAQAASETAVPAPAPSPARGVRPVDELRRGKALLDAGDAPAAAEAFRNAAEADPDSTLAVYNLGAAQHAQGRFREAAESFRRAAEMASSGAQPDRRLATNSVYNRAASMYAATRTAAEAADRARQAAESGRPPTDSAPAVDPKELEQAIADAREGFTGFRDAAIADPADRESRANAEQSRLLLRALEDLQRQQQEQQDGDDQQQQQDQQQDQQQQQDQPKDQQQSDGDPQDGTQGEPDQPEDRPQDQGSDPKDRPNEQPKPPEPPAGESPDPAEAKEQPPDEPPPPSASGAREQMSKEEADRLLQAVRDRERQRRAEQERAAQQAIGPRRPPARDW